MGLSITDNLFRPVKNMWVLINNRGYNRSWKCLCRATTPFLLITSSIVCQIQDKRQWFIIIKCWLCFSAFSPSLYFYFPAHRSCASISSLLSSLQLDSVLSPANLCHVLHILVFVQTYYRSLTECWNLQSSVLKLFSWLSVALSLSSHFFSFFAGDIFPVNMAERVPFK